jgi:hypothetical protein
MDEIWTRVTQDLSDRITGPMSFRLILQPLMAAFFAIRSGMGDARSGAPPYFWSLVNDPSHRADMLKDGWKAVGKVFTLALVLDVAYQFIVLGFVYPFEALFVAVVLALVPYLLLRGAVTRWAGGK